MRQSSTSDHMIQLDDVTSIPVHRNFQAMKEQSMGLDDTISLCAQILENIISFSSHRIQTSSDTENLLDNIEIKEYLIRVVNYMQLDQSMLILSLMLLDKFLALNQDFVLNDGNVHKLMFLCMMETEKFYDDNSFSNADFSVIGGIPVKELLDLEIKFMDLVCFQLFITDEKFDEYSRKMNSLWLSKFT